jgi:hypothetical protein
VNGESTWSKAVRNAMRKGGAEFLIQKVLTKAAGNWSKELLPTTNTGWEQVRQTASPEYKNAFNTSEKT